MFPFPRDTAGSVGTQAQGTTGAKCVVTTTTTTCVNTFLLDYSDGGTRYRSVLDQTLFLDKLLTLPMGNLDHVAR